MGDFPEDVMQRARAQMSTLGNVLMMWANVELVMEMHIQKQLDINLKQSCIVCAPLGAGAKFNLLASLANGDQQLQPLVDAIREFQNLAGRNAIAHGFITFHKIDQPWVLVSREVKNKFTVKHRTITDYYKEEFMPAFDKVMAQSGFTDDDIHQYGLAIARLQLEGGDPAHRPPE